MTDRAIPQSRLELPREQAMAIMLDGNINEKHSAQYAFRRGLHHYSVLS
jgi:hypothetical protein